MRYFTMHPTHPQPRLIGQAVELLRAGEIIIYPTDTTYALGCSLSAKAAQLRIRQLRDLPERHPMTLICQDISQASQYATVRDSVFRLMKQRTPGPYTFILPATKLVPRQVQGKKRKDVGIRIPDNAIAQALVNKLNEPMLSASLWLPEEALPVDELRAIMPEVESQVALIFDVGEIGIEPSTIIDFTSNVPEIVREGKGDIADILKK